MIFDAMEPADRMRHEQERAKRDQILDREGQAVGKRSAITRVKIEATGESESAVQEKLLAAWEAVKGHTNGEWEIEREMTRTDARGCWGMLIVKRKENDGF